jgi:hypothetical protein
MVQLPPRNCLFGKRVEAMMLTIYRDGTQRVIDVLQPFVSDFLLIIQWQTLNGAGFSSSWQKLSLS